MGPVMSSVARSPAMADVYEKRSYARVPVGFGHKPAIVVVDYQMGFTDAQYPLGGAPLVIRGVENTRRLLDKARKCGVPVANCYTAYLNEAEMPYWKVEAVRESFLHGHPCTELDPRIYGPRTRHPDLQDRRVDLLRHHRRFILRQAARGHGHRHRLRDQRLHPRHGDGQLQPPLPAPSFPKTASATMTRDRTGTTCATCPGATPTSPTRTRASSTSRTGGGATPPEEIQTCGAAARWLKTVSVPGGAESRRAISDRPQDPAAALRRWPPRARR